MSIVFDAAEALNLVWGLLADRGTETLKDRLMDRVFRRRVIDRTVVALGASTDALTPAVKAELRRLLDQPEFVLDLVTPGRDPISTSLGQISRADSDLVRDELTRALLSATLAESSRSEIVMMAQISEVLSKTQAVMQMLSEIKATDRVRAVLPGNMELDSGIELDSLVFPETLPWRRLSELSPVDLGIHIDGFRTDADKEMQPYVNRVIDSSLRFSLENRRGLLVGSRIILFTAQPISGSSRTVYEALRHRWASRIVIRLDARSKHTTVAGSEQSAFTALVQAVEAGLHSFAHNGSDVLVWVDRWDAFVLDGLTMDSLRRLHAVWPEVVIVGPISQEAVQDLQGYDDELFAAVAAMDLSLPKVLDGWEIDAARTIYGGQLSEREIRELASSLARADYFDRQMRSSSQEVQAVVESLIFLTTVCRYASAPSSLIVEVANKILAGRQLTAGVSREDLRLACVSTTGGYGNMPLVERVQFDDGPEAFYKLTSMVAQTRPVDFVSTNVGAWEAVTNNLLSFAGPAAAESALEVGTAAIEHNMPDFAVQLLLHAAAEPALEPVALLNLGGALERAGYLAQAVQTWLAAMNSSEHRVRQAALINLSCVDAVPDSYEIDEEDIDSELLSAMRALNRATAEEAKGNSEEARKIYEGVARSGGGGKPAQVASLRLARAARDAGNFDEAEAWYGRATSGTEYGPSREAWFELAHMKRRQAPREAIEIYSRLAKSGSRIEAELAMVECIFVEMDLATQRQRTVHSVEWIVKQLLRLSNSGSTESVRQRARISLPVGLTYLGDYEGAIEAYNELGKEFRDAAAFLEAGLLAEKFLKDASRAVRFYTLALRAATNDEVLGRAAFKLGVIGLGFLDRTSAAYHFDKVNVQSFFKTALSSNIDSVSEKARFNLGANWISFHPEDLDGALELLEPLLRSNDRVLRAQATYRYALLCRSSDKARAARLLQKALGYYEQSGEVALAVAVARDLEQLNIEQ